MKTRQPLEAGERNNILLFVFGQATTLLFITLLQIAPFSLFVPLLILMHVGIAMFILSRRRLLKKRREVCIHYRFVYALFALYLPLLAYKLFGRFAGGSADQDFIVTATLVLAAFCLVVATVNATFMVRSLKSD